MDGARCGELSRIHEPQDSAIVFWLLIWGTKTQTTGATAVQQLASGIVGPAMAGPCRRIRLRARVRRSVTGVRGYLT